MDKLQGFQPTLVKMLTKNNRAPRNHGQGPKGPPSSAKVK